MDGLTSSRIRRLISNRKYKTVSLASIADRSFCGISREKIQRAVCTRFWLKQRKFHAGKGQWKGCERAACLAVGKQSEQKEAYKMAESPKGMMAVLAGGNKGQKILNDPGHFLQSAWKKEGQRLLEISDNSRPFLAALVLIQGRRLWYVSSGSFKIAVCRNNKLLLLPENSNGCNGKEEQGPVFLNHGDYVLLMSPGLYGQISWELIEDCLNQQGSCEEKALRLVNLSRQNGKKESLSSAVVVIQLG